MAEVVAGARVAVKVDRAGSLLGRDWTFSGTAMVVTQDRGLLRPRFCQSIKQHENHCEGGSLVSFVCPGCFR